MSKESQTKARRNNTLAGLCVDMSGQSIAAASDAVSRNGIGKTIFAWFLLLSGGVIFLGVKYGLPYYLKWKETERSIKHSTDLEATKHMHRLEEAKQKNELKKDLIDYRRQTRQESTLTTNVEVNPNVENASVQTYDEVVSGEDTPVDNLRLGLRCFHIGEDCGLMGRTQIGKTSWVLQYSMALARGFQENNAKLASDWKLNQPMTVLYFAFEQDQTFFRAKYGKAIKSVPNLYVEVKTNACDFGVIQKKIIKMQKGIGNRRLLVVFDNITKMKYCSRKDKSAFFEWLEN